jgi:hypothetical protein
VLELLVVLVLVVKVELVLVLVLVVKVVLVLLLVSLVVVVVLVLVLVVKVELVLVLVLVVKARVCFSPHPKIMVPEDVLYSFFLRPQTASRKRERPATRRNISVVPRGGQQSPASHPPRGGIFP